MSESRHLATVAAELSLADWPTIPEAAAKVGASQRTIERRIAAGEIETRTRPRPGKRPETVCHPRDIDKLLPPAHVMPTNGSTALQVRRTEIGPTFDAAVERIASILTSSRDTGGNVAITEKLWLTLDEAAELSGLGYSVLKGLAKPVGPHGALRVQRKALEAFNG
jgi:hypothetical protein